LQPFRHRSPPQRRTALEQRAAPRAGWLARSQRTIPHVQHNAPRWPALPNSRRSGAPHPRRRRFRPAQPVPPAGINRPQRTRRISRSNTVTPRHAMSRRPRNAASRDGDRTCHVDGLASVRRTARCSLDARLSDAAS
jgi:hypothetical protein